MLISILKTRKQRTLLDFEITRIPPRRPLPPPQQGWVWVGIVYMGLTLLPIPISFCPYKPTLLKFYSFGKLSLCILCLPDQFFLSSGQALQPALELCETDLFPYEYIYKIQPGFHKGNVISLWRWTSGLYDWHFINTSWDCRQVLFIYQNPWKLALGWGEEELYMVFGSGLEASRSSSATIFF